MSTPSIFFLVVLKQLIVILAVFRLLLVISAESYARNRP